MVVVDEGAVAEEGADEAWGVPVSATKDGEFVEGVADVVVAVVGDKVVVEGGKVVVSLVEGFVPFVGIDVLEEPNAAHGTEACHV